MKKLFLLIFFTISILLVDAQSQTISGTLLPKKGESVTYLPKASEAQKSNNDNTQLKQQDTVVNKTTVKKILNATNEKPLVKTKVPAAKVPFDSKGFIFSLPVVQGKNSTTDDSTPAKTETPVANEEPKQTTTTVAKPEDVANNFIPPAVKKSENEPLKYEEPPTTDVSPWTAPPQSISTTKLDALEYGPPPVGNVSATNDNKVDDKKGSLRSPNFKGEYKPTLNKPILLIPISPNEMEDGVPKKKETEPSVYEVEKPKPIEDLYPPLNYTVPASVAMGTLRSPKIEGAYVASKNNPVVLQPIQQNSKIGEQQNGKTLSYQEPPVQTPSNNNVNTNSSNTSRSEQVSTEPNIFDENYTAKPSVTSKPIYTKYKKATTYKRVSKPVTKPNYQTIKQPTNAKPVKKFKKTFLKPVKQSLNNGSTSFN